MIELTQAIELHADSKEEQKLIMAVDVECGLDWIVIGDKSYFVVCDDTSKSDNNNNIS